MRDQKWEDRTEDVSCPARPSAQELRGRWLPRRALTGRLREAQRQVQRRDQRLLPQPVAPAAAAARGGAAARVPGRDRHSDVNPTGCVWGRGRPT